MENKRLQSLLFVMLLGGVSILMFVVFKPFFSILVLALVLTVLFRPLHKKLVRLFKGGNNLFAFAVVLLALVFIIIPILFFGLQILGQTQSFFAMTQYSQGQYLTSIQHTIETLVRHVFPSFSFSISDYASRALAFVSNNLGGLISQTAYILFQTFFLLFAFFFFLRDGDDIFNSIVSLSPFSKEQNKKIVDATSRTIKSVVHGTLFVGLIRLILLMAGFYLFGIPNTLLWGSIGGIIGAIPGLGTPFVIVPAILYLIITGNIFFAIAMGLFGFLMIFFIDNILSAYYFGKGLDASPIFILLSILGGIIAFGPLGFIFGPIILSLFISILDMYKILILKESS